MQWIQHCILWIFVSCGCSWISSDLHIWYDQNSHPAVRGNTFLIQCKIICNCLQGLTGANKNREVSTEEEAAPNTYSLCACDIGLFYDHFYRGTGKIVNTWNISGMFIALWPITVKIRTRELATKPQTVINVRAFRLVFSRLFFFFSLNTITFQKYFWCSRTVN